MTGAACLAAEAVLRSGAGLATLAVPQGILPVVSSKLTCCTFLALPETPEGSLALAALSQLLDSTRAAEAAAIGPGLTQHPETAELVRQLVAEIHCPTVLDADGLNAFAGLPEKLSECRSPLVLTPHPGEMGRLILQPTRQIQLDREKIAVEFSKNKQFVLVLKGHNTLVTDGRRLYVNPTGNPGMATGGSGDVLTGVLAGLLAQGIPSYDAAKIGVYVHGLAGDLAVKELGEISLTAVDILGKLSAAFQHYQKSF